MQQVQSLFSGNPFATQVGQLIEQATSPTLPSEEWNLNLTICDVINETEEGPKDAIRALRRRLNQSAGKNNTVTMYTLVVLETCVKNCGHRFHLQIATKEFMNELVKIISPKNNPPLVIQEKVLGLIQSWADAFRAHAEFREIEKTYLELKQRGVEFPMTNLDDMVPINDPPKSSSLGRNPPISPAHHQPSTGTSPAHVAPPAGDQMASPDNSFEQPSQQQVGKLQQDIQVVHTNVEIMNAMLNEFSNTEGSADDYQLLFELNNTCKQMQARLIDLIGKVSTEQIVERLIQVNDDLNNVLLRYERFQKHRAMSNVTPPNVASVSSTSPAKTQPTMGNLIDVPSSAANSNPVNVNDISLQMARNRLDDIPATSAAIGSNRPTGTSNGDDFDVFAQSRQTFESSKPAIPLENVYANQRDDNVANGSVQSALQAKAGGGVNSTVASKPLEVDEMERWLKETDDHSLEQGQTANLPPSTGGNAGATMSSSEFDRFLSERAASVDAGSAEGSAAKSGRQMHSKEKEDTMFAL